MLTDEEDKENDEGGNGCTNYFQTTTFFAQEIVGFTRTKECPTILLQPPSPTQSQKQKQT